MQMQFASSRYSLFISLLVNRGPDRSLVWPIASDRWLALVRKVRSSNVRLVTMKTPPTDLNFVSKGHASKRYNAPDLPLNVTVFITPSPRRQALKSVGKAKPNVARNTHSSAVKTSLFTKIICPNVSAGAAAMVIENAPVEVA